MGRVGGIGGGEIGRREGDQGEGWVKRKGREGVIPQAESSFELGRQGMG